HSSTRGYRTTERSHGSSWKRAGRCPAGRVGPDANTVRHGRRRGALVQDAAAQRPNRGWTVPKDPCVGTGVGILVAEWHSNSCSWLFADGYRGCTSALLLSAKRAG